MTSSERAVRKAIESADRDIRQLADRGDVKELEVAQESRRNLWRWLQEIQASHTDMEDYDE